MSYGELDKYNYHLTDGIDSDTCLTCKHSYMSSYGDPQCIKVQGSIISECGTCTNYDGDEV
jgi:hypothetical protein